MSRLTRFVASLALIAAAFGAGWVYRGAVEWFRSSPVPINTREGIEQ